MRHLRKIFAIPTTTPVGAIGDRGRAEHPTATMSIDETEERGIDPGIGQQRGGTIGVRGRPKIHTGAGRAPETVDRAKRGITQGKDHAIMKNAARGAIDVGHGPTGMTLATKTRVANKS